MFTDTDVALVRDPFPYLLWDNVDYVHSLNAICTKEDTWDFRKSKEEGNTGFYFVRSSPRTIKLWADAFAAVPKFPGLDDQAVFWRVIRQSQDPPILPLGKCKHHESPPSPPSSPSSPTPPLVTCVLDPCVFSSGMLSRYAYVPN